MEDLESIVMLIPPVATYEDIDKLIKTWDDCLTEPAEVSRS